MIDWTGISDRLPTGIGDRLHRNAAENAAVANAGEARRAKRRTRCLVAMEACGGSQHWARQLIELGHEVRPAVRAFVTRESRTRARMRERSGRRFCSRVGRTVSIKTEEQQAVLALHRLRAQLVKFRTASDALRGFWPSTARSCEEALGASGAEGWSGSVAGDGHRDSARDGLG